ncbi:MlaC/ttg2D family ABC transporter substrate-binding protein [Ferrovum myxofaciens]|uniref:MlaC/ttg2D family ABC transporter substrate-binding protein n=1 Tax=Ferrovum myxofaciens TaxID=416213 RepID=UPI002357C0D1|nr:ABC transporter substrate-binding protein [Ferrovum myxofaciens]
MKRWAVWQRVGVAVTLAGWNLAVWAAITPESVISNTADEVVATLKKDKAIQNGDRARAYALIQDKVLPHFDFTRMTRLAMGKNWRQASPEQQQKLTEGFRDLLVRTYATSLSQYKNQELKVKGSDLYDGGNEATVHSVVIPSGGPIVPIDYRMEKLGDDWKVFDIQVDGVSLVTNYRNEFSDIVRNHGIDGLIQAMADKSKQAESKTAGKK